MSDAEKQPWFELANDAKERVEKQKLELAAKGYYTLENGTKSTDPENADLLKVKARKSRDGSKKQSALDLDADDESEEEKFVHPPPKRAGSAWLYFNTEFCKKFVQDGGARGQAFSEASQKWNSLSEEEK